MDGQCHYSVVTAHKRSLGQGNIFIGVCQGFCSQEGGSRQGAHPPEGGTPSPQQGDLPPEGGSHPARETHGEGGNPWQGDPPEEDTPLGKEAPPPRWLLQRAIRILLECILV